MYVYLPHTNGHESEWTPGVGAGQGGLACCDSWGRKESDMTERLNWTEVFIYFFPISILAVQDKPQLVSKQSLSLPTTLLF